MADTLPDLLQDALEIVFVGINPSLYSAARGHYFARRSNRFWPCFSRSVLSQAARRAFAVERLEPEHDAVLTAYGFGFTDLVKRATARASDLQQEELTRGVAELAAKLERHRPRLACFHAPAESFMGKTGENRMHDRDVITVDITHLREAGVSIAGCVG